MKLSLNFPDRTERRRPCHVVGNDNGQGRRDQQQPILKAKIPITVLSQPFATSVTATTAAPSDLSLSLSTNFPSGPSLKLSYSPNATPSSASPFSVALKSGLGLFGSPKDSPLSFSVHFPLSPSLSHSTPIFSLQFKPRIGHFSMHSSASSNSKPSQTSIFKPLVASDSALNGSFLRTEAPDSKNLAVKTIPRFNQASDHLRSDPNGVIGPALQPAEASVTRQELRLEPCGVNGNRLTKPNPVGNLDWVENCKNRGDACSGVSFGARTALTITKNLRMNFRWGVNFPGNGFGCTMPYLTVQKISLERDEEVKNLKAESSSEIRTGGTELLKGLWLWMRRDLEVIERENEEMKQYLEEMRWGIGKRVSVSPLLGENKGDFEIWRNKRSGREENGMGLSWSATRSLDVESELKRAIKSSS